MFDLRYLIISIIITLIPGSVNSYPYKLSSIQISNIQYAYDLASHYDLGEVIATMAYMESSGGTILDNDYALGILQIRPSTARYILKLRCGKSFYIEEEQLSYLLLHNHDFNITLAIWYMQYLMDKFDGSTPHAILAYNVGPSYVQKYGLTHDPSNYVTKYYLYKDIILQQINLRSNINGSTESFNLQPR